MYLVEREIYTDLNENELRDNYYKLKDSELQYLEHDPESELIENSSRLPISHTTDIDSLVKIVKGTKFVPSGLYSSADRGFKDFSLSENWKSAACLGLHQYVTGFVGIHDPVAIDKTNNEPVGIFIKRSQNHKPNEAFYSFRDFRSYCPFPNGTPITQLTTQEKASFLIAEEHVDSLLACDISRNHSNNIWDYWGNPDSDDFRLMFLQGGSYWSNKFIYYHFSKISVKDFALVLYPSNVFLSFETMSNEDFYLRDPILFDLEQVLGDKILIYRYIKDSFQSFHEASFDAAKYYMKYNEFPTNLDEWSAREPK